MQRVLVSLALGIALAVPAFVSFSDAPRQAERCPEGNDLAWSVPGACEHTDEPPAGVDVTDPVSTADLRSRDGGGAEAYAAAQDLGVAAPVQAAAASPAVSCEGDGTSGYRTQAMYVVEAGRTNRFASLQSSLQLWAAGVDDVFNRSAALTGGVRHVRYVTDTDGSTCVARVLNVTVPAGSMTSFNATISAVQALGYDNPARKYLMWTDATVLCGIASMYPNDGDGQGNPNNGSYAQYARIDSGCWGFGDGGAQHSVEAHELLHTMGGVMSTAPHGTRAGHCWDEADTMCYADGGGFAMQQICPSQREYLLDCNNDDYYSTYPDPGSWLDSHWNAADSRFLIGGGDGSGGGALGAPTVLGATIAVNNPAVPGLATQASVAPVLPAGRTVSRVVWKSARTDCTFTTPTELQTDVTCNAGSSTATKVTVTLTDSSGATKTLTSPLTFAGGPGRAVTVALGAAGQTPGNGGSAGVCTGAPFGLAATVVDTASGQRVKGITAVLTKQTATITAPASAGAPMTTATGTATQSQTATVATTYRATTKAGTVFAAASPVSLSAVPAKCTTALTAEADQDQTYYGDPVVVSGRLTAQSGSAEVIPAGAALAIKLTTPAGKVLALGSAKVGADGTYAATTKPTTSGTISVALTGTSAYVAATATAGAVTVDLPTTSVTGAVNKSDVGYGDPVVVTGTLTRDAGGTVTPVASKSVAVYVTPSGGTAVKVGAGTTTANGSFTATIPLRVNGALSVVWVGAVGLPASSDDVGAVTAGTWSTAVTATSAATSVTVGGSTTLTGSATRTYGGATTPLARMKLKVIFRATGSTTDVVITSVTTTVTGTFTAKIYPKASGAWRVALTGTAGYGDATSATRTISVG